jgi:hypothetical protein
MSNDMLLVCPLCASPISPQFDECEFPDIIEDNDDTQTSNEEIRDDDGRDSSPEVDG